MNKRQFLKGMAATAAGILVPGHVLSGQYEFHQRVPGLKSSNSNSDPAQTENTGHGPQSLTHGDTNLGFYGFVSASEFITGDALADAIGLTVGTSQFSNDGWFKYSFQGKTRYVAKKPFRHTVNWQQIYQCGAVYGTFDDGVTPSGPARTQDAVVKVDGIDYIVKLMRGVSADPISINTNGFDLTQSHSSEWNSVFYRLHNGIHTDNGNTLASETTKSSFEQWASYSENELQMDYRTGNGSASWTQETPVNNSQQRAHRGYWGVSSVLRAVNTATNNDGGWRPVLEKI